ncbi:MAG: hypothetical protein ACRDZR_10115 [Acidimicrobiales bacterium]
MDGYLTTGGLDPHSDRKSQKTTQLGPVRDALLKKALCYSPRFNELAFTVPMFDEFMKRWLPEPP